MSHPGNFYFAATSWLGLNRVDLSYFNFFSPRDHGKLQTRFLWEKQRTLDLNCTIDKSSQNMSLNASNSFQTLTFLNRSVVHYVCLFVCFLLKSYTKCQSLGLINRFMYIYITISKLLGSFLANFFFIQTSIFYENTRHIICYQLIGVTRR